MGAFFIGRLLKKSHQAFVLEHRLVRRSARPSQPKLLRRSRPATPPRGLSIGCDDLTIFEQPDVCKHLLEAQGEILHLPKPTKEERMLTRKQELFVSEYLVDLNATQAASRAGYSAR